MGSHLTDALVGLGANVHAFVRATSSGALNNIAHLRRDLKVHFADLTDRTSIDYLVRELRDAPDRPYVFHLGAQAHVGESVAPALRDRDGEHGRHAQPPPVDRRLGARAREVRHGGHVGGVRQRPRRRHRPPHVRRRGLADPPRALADQPEVDLRDRQGRGRLPHDELLRRLRPPGRRDADVQQLRAAPEPALRHRDDRHPGAHPARDRARRARAAARLLLLHATASAATSRSPRTAGPATSTCTGRARTSRWPTGPT